MAEFKDRLDLALKRKNLSAAELSRIADINEGAISQYRKGAYKATQENLEKLSIALDVSIPWLMGADVPMQKEKSPAELTEGEKAVLELFRQIPKDKQDLALEMLRAALQAK